MLRLKDRINLNEDTMAEQEIKPKQKIEYINIDKLVLWDDNPRDPFKKNASNQEIAERAISVDGQSKWKLKSFCESMGEWLDISEAPTVFYDGDKPVVYDGNRRVLIGKIIHGCVKVRTDIDFSKIDFPEEIPCNVCDEPTALKNVERKHVDDSSWGSLERDAFEHSYMKKKKSFFLVLNEKTNIISDYPFMNQRFVKEEIFTTSNLNYLNISAENGILQKLYSDSDFKIVLDRIILLVSTNTISTRKNRGKLIALLEQDPKIKDIISKDTDSKTKPDVTTKPDTTTKPPAIIKPKPRNKSKKNPLFGEYTLNFKDEIIENLFLDLRHLHSEIYKDKSTYSEYATMIVAMGLRLLCQVADKKYKRDLNKYIDKYFEYAENELTDDEKDYLGNHNVKKKNMARLLNEGAHKNSDVLSREQIVSLSLIIVKILEKTHGK